MNRIVIEKKEPFAIDNTVFVTFDDSYNVYSSATLVVPDGAKNFYQSTSGWSDFSKISEISEQKVRSIHVVKAGTLSNYISDPEKYLIEELTITGELNGTDFWLIRDLGGVTCEELSSVRYPSTKGKLVFLDLSNASIVSGGKYYTMSKYTDGGGINTEGFEVYTKDNRITNMLFAKTKIETIILPNNTISIDPWAFWDCKNLTSLTIPENVKAIGNGAFSSCTGLVFIILPSNLNSIGYSAFSGCNSLTDVYCEAEAVPSAENNSFYNPGNITLYVPLGSQTAYKSTEPWSKFKACNTFNYSEATEKCSKPTISMVNGKFAFSCETSGASYRWNISIPNGSNGEGYFINQPIFRLNVYATKSGYLNSDVATYVFNGLVGDVDGNGVVNVADHVKLSSIIMEQSE